MAFNVGNAILYYLQQQTEPQRKSAIAAATGYAVGTLTNKIAELHRAGFIAESRGYYVITALGKNHLEADPFLLEKPKPKPVDTIVIEIPIAELTAVSREMTINKQYADKLALIKDKLQAMAILYAVAAKVPLPDYQSQDLNEDEMVFGKNAQEFVSKLLQS